MSSIARFALCLALFLAATPAARANYVFYHQQFGDWTVLCWDDQSGRGRQCSLYAPRASLGHRNPPNVIQIHEYASNTYQVVLMVRDRVIADLPAFIRIDGHKFHEAVVGRSYARWVGAEAQRIIAEMRSGAKITARVQTQPDGMPRDIRISLQGFDDALATYRKTIRAQGILRDAAVSR